MDRKKHLIDCGAFLVMFLYGNAKLYAATKDINVGLSAGPLASAIISYKLEAENIDRLE